MNAGGGFDFVVPVLMFYEESLSVVGEAFLWKY
jgi:hypothetical protein